jgi:hypothetical protein
MQQDAAAEPIVTRLGGLDPQAVSAFFSARGLELVPLPAEADIPGSYWGAPEAGLIGNRLYARPDTPVHSVLHEACHYLCMDQARRAGLHTDAGGTDTEENAVCYLQALLAGDFPGYTRAQLFADMDAWGYHFILGSARAWFEGDAQDARAWLRRADLIDAEGGFNYQ